MAATATALARKRETVNGEQLIRTICLNVQPMSTEAFAPYGRIVTDRGDIVLDFDGGQASVAAQTVEARPMCEIENRLFNKLGDTHEKTFALYRAGLNIAEIAERRELKTSTIEEHISLLIADGRAVNPNDFVDPAERALIEAAIESCAQAGQAGLKPIKESLPEHIGYGAIKIVAAALRHRQQS